MQLIEIGDTQFAVEDRGNTDREVLILSNSLGCDMHMWDLQVPALTRHFRLIRYDTRGHGRTDVTPGPYTIEMLGRDVLGILDHFSVERAHFLGLSMGGMTGMWLGVHAPNRLSRLILSNTGAKIGTAATWHDRIETVLAHGMPAVTETVLERWFTPRFRAEAPDQVAPVRRQLLATPAAGYANCCAAIRDADLRDAITAIALPTLVIAGAHDPSTPPADGQLVADRIPGARYVELDAAHLSNIEARDGFEAAVLGFLGA